jgi:predicted NBD/HSP70 family sugar kinase
MNELAALLETRPRCPAALDAGFVPAALVARGMQRRAAATGAAVPVGLAIEQADGSVFHHQAVVLPAGHALADCNGAYLERLVKFLLWSRGGFRVHVQGPAALVEQLRGHYAQTAIGRFDAEIMGGRIYERPFEIVPSDALPPARAATVPLGRHLDGCRIGFDLGASDLKAAAVVDGTVVFSEERPWQPVAQPDPRYHYEHIMALLQAAAAHLPRVDAIGGSAAGVYVNNRVKVASLFRGVPPAQFAKAKDIFLELQAAWHNVPFEVVNDGEVTALAGAMALNDNAVLGIALGSSQAAGYCTPEGTITSWLNELAFAPVDYAAQAPRDEWSGDIGCGVQYFSQQCVGRLLEPAGMAVDPAMALPEKLVQVQQLMQQGDARAQRVYATIGVYLGYAIAHYAEFYDMRHVLILGRVTSGAGGAVILEQARNVLRTEFPRLAEQIAFHTPDERDKRHGQAIAAASLPVVARTPATQPEEQRR